MSPLGRVLNALSANGCDPKQCQGSYKAKCPAHEDRNPSLSIKESDGRVLLNCFASCRTEDIVAALGLGMSDLFEDNQTAKPEIIAQYDYNRLNGSLSFQVVRYFPKDFRQRRPDGKGNWVWSLKDLSTEDRELPFGLNELAKVPTEDRECLWITEGEKDALKLWSDGSAATCNAGGTGMGWQDGHSKHVIDLGFREISIWADRDPAGAKHALSVMGSLLANGFEGELAMWIANCSDGCKDASDLISKHGTSWVDLVEELTEPSTTSTTSTTLQNTSSEPMVSRAYLRQNLRQTFDKTLTKRLGVAGEFAQALAESCQVAPELAVAAVIGALALPVGLGVSVNVRRGWREPAILQTLILARPSERKTPVFTACMSPLFDAQRDMRNQRKQAITKAKAQQAESERAKKSGGYPEEQVTIPPEFRAFAGKGTAEGWEVVAAEQGGRLAIASDEGGGVLGDLKRYGKAANYEMLIAGHDAEHYSSDRVGRKSVMLDEMRVPVFLTAQPNVWDDLKADKDAPGRGVIARLSVIRPESLVGSRVGLGQPMPTEVVDTWHTLAGALMAQAYISDQATILDLSSEALAKFVEYKDRIERELDQGMYPGEVLEGWGGKHAGLSIRLAAVCHAARTGTLGGTISLEEMELAIEIAEWLKSHMLREFSNSAELLSKDAKRLADIAAELGEFKQRDAMHKAGWKLDRFLKAAHELENIGLLDSLGNKSWQWTGPSEDFVEDFVEDLSKVESEKTPAQEPCVEVVENVEGFVEQPEPERQDAKRVCSQCGGRLINSSGDICRGCQAREKINEQH